MGTESTLLTALRHLALLVPRARREPPRAIATALLEIVLHACDAAHGAIVRVQAEEAADAAPAVLVELVASSPPGAEAPTVPGRLLQRRGALGAATLMPSADGSCWLRYDLGPETTLALVLQWDAAADAGGQEMLAALADGVVAVLACVEATGLGAHSPRDERARSADLPAPEQPLSADLLASVSHELRTPLATIHGYAATLRRHGRRLPRGEQDEFLDAIVEAAVRMEHTVRRLLQLAELESGAVRLDRMATDLAAVARQAIADATTLAAGRGAGRAAPTFVLTLLDDSGQPTTEVPPVWADAQRLRDVLDDLLRNATTYSPQRGQVTVTLQPHLPACESQGEGPMLELRIADQGIGIPREHLARVFDRFHRVDTRLTREVEGLGIGLTLCKQVVELHGGAIWLESVPGRGSVVTLRLPCAVPAALANRSAG